MIKSPIQFHFENFTSDKRFCLLLITEDNYFATWLNDLAESNISRAVSFVVKVFFKMEKDLLEWSLLEEKWNETQEEVKSSEKTDEIHAKLDQIANETSRNLTKDEIQALEEQATLLCCKAIRHSATEKNLRHSYLKRAILMGRTNQSTLAKANIELARQFDSVDANGADARATETLNLIEKQTAYDLKQLKKNDKKMENKRPKTAESSSIMKLSYDPHPNVPWIVNCFEIKENNRSMFFVAKRKLRVGDIISIEHPIMFVEHYEDFQFFCITCYRFRPFTLIPCLNCTEGKRDFISLLLI